MRYQDTAIRTSLAVVLILSLALLGCKKKEAEKKKEIRAVPVIIGEVSSRNVEYELDQVGTLEASHEVTLRSAIEGHVTDILFEEGREVKKGEILVTLDAAKIQAEIRNLEARMEQLKIRLENKKRTLQRYAPLIKKDLISQQQYDDLLSETKEIDAEIIQAKANLARQKELLSYTVIKAPFDGVAGARNFSVGHYLKVGDPVVAIVTLDPLEIAFHAPEKFKSDIFVGQDVVLRVDPHPDRSFTGKIFFISPRVDVDTRSFLVKARVSNNKPLLNPGMFARVRVITEVHEKALTIPWESVIQTEEETCIYVVEGEVARKVVVRLGKTTPEWAEILTADLSPGTPVILEGKFAVKDGTKVEVKK